jgi:DNA topoisomerase-1
METITYEEVMELFKLPKEVGDYDGNLLVVNNGRYGPYVKYGDKFVSLGQHDPYTVEKETALMLVAEKKEKDANRLILDFADEGIQVLNGRYGPYVTDGEKNARIPKEVEEPKTLSLEDCIELLKNAKPGRGKKKSPKKKTAAKKTRAKKAGKKKASKKKAVKKS